MKYTLVFIETIIILTILPIKVCNESKIYKNFVNSVV